MEKHLLGRHELPDMGPPLPVAIKMEIDPALPAARLQYVDACNHPGEIRIGEDLEAMLLESAHQTFKTVYFAGQEPPSAKPDITARITLQQSGLKINTDNVYDRLPAELTLEAGVAFYDSSGKLLAEQPLAVTHKDKLLLEPTQHRCAYVSVQSFANAAAIGIASQFMKQAREVVKPTAPAAAAPGAGHPEGVAAAQQPAEPAAPGAPGLAFKATLLDENGNLILEGGERVRLRVDLVNAGRLAARDVQVTVSGTPAVVAQFPASTLPVGTLQPGESRSVEFAGTLPPSLPSQRVEMKIALSEASGLVGLPATQVLVAAMRPAREPAPGPGAAAPRFDDVDQVPAAPPGVQQPQLYVVAVGISTYRDPQPFTRKYAAADAELVAAYFQALGGVPAANVKVLRDKNALRPDLEEVLLDWLPSRVTEQSVVIVYFAGLATASPSGDVALLPYEAGANGTARLYPLKDLAAALAKLRTRQVLLIFDGPTTRPSGAGKGPQKALRWDAGGNHPARLIASPGFQPAIEPDTVRHGLFTYYLIRGLRGDADKDGNGAVTVGELAAFLTQTVPSASRSTFKQELQPLVLPSLRAGHPLAGLTLTRPAGAVSAAR
ncbi:hypothetical protein [Nitrospira sp. Kam-Ns4a]